VRRYTSPGHPLGFGKQDGDEGPKARSILSKTTEMISQDGSGFSPRFGPNPNPGHWPRAGITRTFGAGVDLLLDPPAVQGCGGLADGCAGVSEEP
jgi:hypothetical protein